MNQKLGWKFRIHTDENIGTTLQVVSDADFASGFVASMEFPRRITNLLDNLIPSCSELMEGVWEINESDIDEIRQALTYVGFEEFNTL